jgi:hypothetical protein
LRNIQCILMDIELPFAFIDITLAELSVMARDMDIPVIFSKFPFMVSPPFKISELTGR